MLAVLLRKECYVHSTRYWKRLTPLESCRTTFKIKYIIAMSFSFAIVYGIGE